MSCIDSFFTLFTVRVDRLEREEVTKSFRPVSKLGGNPVS